MAVFAAQHRQRHVAETRRIRASRQPREEPDDETRAEHAIQDRPRLPEVRELLRRVRADAVEKQPSAERLFALRQIGAQRRVRRNEDELVAEPVDRDRKRVIAQTIAAVHARGTGGDVGDPHGWRAFFSADAPAAVGFFGAPDFFVAGEMSKQ